MESGRRLPISGFTTMRSTTISMSCLSFLSSAGVCADVVELAVDLGALEALLLQLGQFLAVLALAAAHDRREQEQPRAFGQRQNAVGHLADGLAFDGKPGGRRIGHADAREQQAQIVVDLGDRADGRARIARGGLLLDGDGGRQALDVIDIRLLHQFQELARIGRQRLDIAALALGIDGVEGERGLARAGQAGQHGQRVARNLDVDILEIVLAGAANGDVFQHGIPSVETRTVAGQNGAATAGRIFGREPRRMAQFQDMGSELNRNLSGVGSSAAHASKSWGLTRILTGT